MKRTRAAIKEFFETGDRPTQSQFWDWIESCFFFLDDGLETLGLGNVDNTSDANKPISTAQQAALDTKVGLTGDQTITGAKTFQQGSATFTQHTVIFESDSVLQSNGEATYSGSNTYNSTATFTMDPNAVSSLKTALGISTVTDAALEAKADSSNTLTTDTNQSVAGEKEFLSDTTFGAQVVFQDEVIFTDDSVFSFAGGSDAALLTALNINEVDNTSDADKPISTATQTALDGKQVKPLLNDSWGTTSLALNTIHQKSTTLTAGATWTITGTPVDGDFVTAYFTTDGTDRTVNIPSAKRIGIANGTAAVTSLVFAANTNHFLSFVRVGGAWTVTSSAEV